jgi:hypothetical protein
VEDDPFHLTLLIELPPSINSIIIVSILEIALAPVRLLLVVVPQYDSCPHGSTYPMNAVAIGRIKIVTSLSYE